jgi:glyoxylase-like metal-dependent hydrolase (beta-lactamase superfamily II)
MGVVHFLTLDAGEFEYGVADPVAPHVRRIIARNPSKFTYRGTGTYVIGDGDVAVVDPGPDLDSHRDALATALDGERVRAILVTHCHSDHSPLAAWLAEETGAPTVAYGPHGDDTWDIGSLPDDFGRSAEPEAGSDDGADPTTTDDRVDDGDDDGDGDEGTPVVEESVDRDFHPTVSVRTGDEAASGPGWRVTALHTPGHTSNHTCYVLESGDGRVLFPGDHVMGWSTTVVSPPDGDMAAYLRSLRLVAEREHDLALPTHGPPIPRPSDYVRALIAHRVERERQVVDAVRRGLTTIPDIVTDLYAEVRIELHRPAGASVLGHLVKLVDDGRVAVVGDGRPRLDSTFGPV